ncbi:MAG: hypothetical protein J07AB43_03980 [Candidatus Nanosalina sp. J07AB43]|nr:MAG: hypothetical protein J07AB43_03980 [Candidatus Nanosalina sp. J07AB43]
MDRSVPGILSHINEDILNMETVETIVNAGRTYIMYLSTFVALIDIIPIPSPADSHRSFSPSDLAKSDMQVRIVRGSSSVLISAVAPIISTESTVFLTVESG